LAKRSPGELSGGQQQRVALARAVVLEPRLLLLDEPLSNLDARLRQSLRQDFVEIHKVTGMTTLLVTHDLEEAFATSDRVAVLSEGRLQQFDTPQGIYTRPQTPFVAEFVGHRNTLEGYRKVDAGRAVLQAAGEDINVPGSAPALSMKFAIPSHALRLGTAPLALDNCFRARLIGLTYLGATAQFDIDFNGIKLGGEQASGKWVEGLRAGDPVYVGWESADMIALPAKVA
jgi:ABC-type Fe3+/spermidine/putrescine transport system ATPase subunit